MTHTPPSSPRTGGALWVRWALAGAGALLAACSTLTGPAGTATKPAATGSASIGTGAVIGASPTAAPAAGSTAAAGAAAPGTTTPGAAVATAPPPPTLPHEQAVLNAATALLSNVVLGPAGAAPNARHAEVIDPLIDGITGAQTSATRAMGEARTKSSTLAKSTLILSRDLDHRPG